MKPKLMNSSLLVDNVSTNITYMTFRSSKLVEMYEQEISSGNRKKRAQNLEKIIINSRQIFLIPVFPANERVKKQQNRLVDERCRLRVTQKNSIRDKQNGTRNEGRCDSTQYRRLRHAALTR